MRRARARRPCEPIVPPSRPVPGRRGCAPRCPGRDHSRPCCGRRPHQRGGGGADTCTRRGGGCDPTNQPPTTSEPTGSGDWADDDASTGLLHSQSSERPGMTKTKADRNGKRSRHRGDNGSGSHGNGKPGSSTTACVPRRTEPRHPGRSGLPEAGVSVCASRNADDGIGAPSAGRWAGCALPCAPGYPIAPETAGYHVPPGPGSGPGMKALGRNLLRWDVAHRRHRPAR